jgi:hypothetical protein
MIVIIMRKLRHIRDKISKGINHDSILVVAELLLMDAIVTVYNVEFILKKKLEE